MRQDLAGLSLLFTSGERSWNSEAGLPGDFRSCSADGAKFGVRVALWTHWKCVYGCSYRMEGERISGPDTNLKMAP